METLAERTQRILDRRAELAPFFNPDDILNPKQVNRFLSQEGNAFVETMQRVYEMLLPFEISMHAMLTDLLTHPEGILLKGQDDRVQTILEEGELVTGISIRPRDVKIKGQKQSLCRNVIFCQTPKGNLRELSAGCMYAWISGASYSDKALTLDFFPRSFNRLLSFEFDKTGRITQFVHQDGRDSAPLWYRLPDGRYLHEPNEPFGFEVQSLQLTYRGNLFRHYVFAGVHRYTYQADGKFHFGPSDKQSPIIEEVVARVLAQVPFSESTHA